MQPEASCRAKASPLPPSSHRALCPCTQGTRGRATPAWLRRRPWLPTGCARLDVDAPTAGRAWRPADAHPAGALRRGARADGLWAHFVEQQASREQLRQQLRRQGEDGSGLAARPLQDTGRLGGGPERAAASVCSWTQWRTHVQGVLRNGGRSPCAGPRRSQGCPGWGAGRTACRCPLQRGTPGWLQQGEAPAVCPAEQHGAAKRWAAPAACHSSK